MFGDDRTWRVQSNNPATNDGIESLGAADQPHLDISDIGDDQLLTREVKPRQGHYNSPSRTARPIGSAKDFIERLVVMLFNVLARRERSAPRELAMSQTVDYPAQRITIPMPDDEGIAIIGVHPARTCGDTEHDVLLL